MNLTKSSREWEIRHTQTYRHKTENLGKGGLNVPGEKCKCPPEPECLFYRSVQGKDSGKNQASTILWFKVKGMILSSKTRGRKQIAWALQSKIHAEMLKTHLAEKTTKKKKNSDTLSPQPAHSLFPPRYTEKPGGLPHHQMLASNLPGRHRPTGEQISGMQYPHSHPWDKPA
jgi:hypothetical protein